MSKKQLPRKPIKKPNEGRDDLQEAEQDHETIPEGEELTEDEGDDPGIEVPKKPPPPLTEP
jgi:hypothetical protein